MDKQAPTPFVFSPTQVEKVAIRLIEEGRKFRDKSEKLDKQSRMVEGMVAKELQMGAQHGVVNMFEWLVDMNYRGPLFQRFIDISTDPTNRNLVTVADALDYPEELPNGLSGKAFAKWVGWQEVNSDS